MLVSFRFAALARSALSLLAIRTEIWRWGSRTGSNEPRSNCSSARRTTSLAVLSAYPRRALASFVIKETGRSNVSGAADFAFGMVTV